MTTDRRRPARRSALLAAGTLLAGAASTLSPAEAGAAAPHNEQVVITSTGEQAPLESDISGTAPVLSADGRFVVFSTEAALVSGDQNGLDDVYLRDTVDGISILVSSRRGKAGNDYSVEPSISTDGRYVSFTTWATNLFDDRNGSTLDVVVKDMYTGRLEVASVDANGRQRGGNSMLSVIAGDGRSVSFQTFSRLGPKDRDRREDVYVRDLVRDRTVQASVTAGGRDVPRSVLNGDLSDDGRIVSFGDSNDLWVHDVVEHRTRRVWHEPDSPPCQPYPMGSAGRPTLSGDGRYLAFSSCATSLPEEDGAHGDVYRMDLGTGRIVRVTAVPGNGNSFLPSLSRTGRFVGMGSEASNFAEGDTHRPDGFVVDLRTGRPVRASESPAGVGSNSVSASTSASISPDGRSLAYLTYATNLVPGDVVDVPEVVVWRAR